MGQEKGNDPSQWNDLWEGRWKEAGLHNREECGEILPSIGSYWQFILVSGFETAVQSHLLTVLVAVC